MRVWVSPQITITVYTGGERTGRKQEAVIYRKTQYRKRQTNKRKYEIKSFKQLNFPSHLTINVQNVTLYTIPDTTG